MTGWEEPEWQILTLGVPRPPGSLDRAIDELRALGFGEEEAADILGTTLQILVHGGNPALDDRFPDRLNEIAKAAATLVSLLAEEQKGVEINAFRVQIGLRELGRPLDLYRLRADLALIARAAAEVHKPGDRRRGERDLRDAVSFLIAKWEERGKPFRRGEWPGGEPKRGTAERFVWATLQPWLPHRIGARTADLRHVIREIVERRK